MTINNAFELENLVFFITDSDQLPRIVTAIQISSNGLLYRLACGTTESWHFSYEIASNKNFI